MEKFKLVISPEAEADLDEIDSRHPKLCEPETAVRQIRRLKEKIFSLRRSPERCSPVGEEYLGIRGIRMLPVDRYLVFYRLRGDVIQIIRVVYGRRDWLELLK